MEKTCQVTLLDPTWLPTGYASQNWPLVVGKTIAENSLTVSILDFIFPKPRWLVSDQNHGFEPTYNPKSNRIEHMFVRQGLNINLFGKFKSKLFSTGLSTVCENLKFSLLDVLHSEIGRYENGKLTLTTWSHLSGCSRPKLKLGQVLSPR